MDKLILKGIQARTVIGIHAEEKLAEQGVTVSLVLHANFSDVIETDGLEAGTDYVDVVEFVRSFCRQHRGNTLEKLADELARRIKEKFGAAKVELTVDKPRYTGKLEMEAIQFHVQR